MVVFTDTFFALFTIAAQVVLVVCAVAYYSGGTWRAHVRVFGEQHGMRFAFLAALAAMLGSLYYSEIVGYEPCKLCWIQRIFMYPQVFLLGMALYLRDRTVAIYGVFLALLGACVALYQYLLQFDLVPALPCSAVVSSVASCSQRFVFQFGYVTIPLMSFTIFLLIAGALWLARRKY